MTAWTTTSNDLLPASYYRPIKITHGPVGGTVHVIDSEDLEFVHAVRRRHIGTSVGNPGFIPCVGDMASPHKVRLAPAEIRWQERERMKRNSEYQALKDQAATNKVLSQWREHRFWEAVATLVFLASWIALHWWFARWV